MRQTASDEAAVAVGGVAAPLAARVIRHAVTTVLAGERRDAAVAVTFLGKDAMRRLNAEHLGHDWPTDVITFALPQPDGSVAGDVYLCRYVAAREARARQQPVRTELLRLVVHGTLHVLGHAHDEGPGRTTSKMWRLQERYVTALA